MRLLTLFFAFVALLLQPVSAAQTEWQEVSPDVRMRLVSTGTISPDGSTLVGIEIDMPQTTKTYWRVPGQTGFAAEIDLSGSRGVSAAHVLWPHPQRVVGETYIDYAYFGPTMLPVEIDVTEPDGELSLSVLLGVCSEICVPAQASFHLPLTDRKPDRVNGLRIKQAQALTPLPWSEGTDPLGQVDYRPGEHAIGVEIKDAGLDLSSLIAATESGEVLFGAPQKSPQGNLVLLPILTKTENSAVEGQEIQLTFMTDMGAFELRRLVVAAKTSN
ncbi:Thiol-disulfide interchange protein, contains DsbC and DsbD domains [Devosia crocina]|uniref:Thiol-disulfide interchange protein, contains DsbC and DsbD domains n=1 Tax=Devosia crocina TaxID=429728 RepID=A0A1I7NNU2_9HYPH|nr:protein-disulfide reductase DsbD domain-containing protein [Devosia crocina]SFV36309.1 Thiol-disulfide interchange protein, contains DsbC and DsbD domains [Devosia crocina]